MAGARTALGQGLSTGTAAPAATAVVTASGATPIASVGEAKGATSSAKPGDDVHSSANRAPVSAGTVAPASEMELLRDARLVLRQSPSRALELTDEHARLYPQGKMTQERELLAVSALVALGRRTAALSRAASFERQFPTSPYRKQLGDLLR